jgi:hypothetical protein
MWDSPAIDKPQNPKSPFIQWEFQDPYIGLIYGRYLQFRILKWPLILWLRFKPSPKFEFFIGFIALPCPHYNNWIQLVECG